MFELGAGSIVKCKIPAIAVQTDAATATKRIEFIISTYSKTYNNMLTLKLFLYNESLALALNLILPKTATRINFFLVNCGH